MMLPEILFEDNHVLVVNKSPGQLVQGDKTGDEPLVDTLKHYIKKKYAKPGEVFLGVVHRLDRPTSGLVVFARTSKALERLNRSFKERAVQKTYWAVVKNAPPTHEDTLIHYLLRNEKTNKSKAYPQPVAGAKEARLTYRVLKNLTNYTLLEIELHTGRHHQIRAQLAAIGCPIKGDLKYGAERSNKDGSIHLHARALILTHPTTKQLLHLLANPPSDPVWDSCLEPNPSALS
jgi:23S rRNA pseudouridine1911/1915/1917 synthase